jgi:hypothetical protein
MAVAALAAGRDPATATCATWRRAKAAAALAETAHAALQARREAERPQPLRQQHRRAGAKRLP